MAEGAWIRTTAGDIDGGELGLTSMHEHLLVDARVWYSPSGSDPGRLRDVRVDKSVKPGVRWPAYAILDNLVMDDPTLAVRELTEFRQAGGYAVVDMTNHGLGIAAGRVKEIADKAGVRVVLGSGFYVHASHPGNVCRSSVEELVERLERELVEGIADSGVRPGVLGEIGMSAPPADCERRILRAAARLAARYGMSVHIHVDGSGAFGPEHVADCVQEGLSADRVVCGHMDEHLDMGYHQEILSMGANLAFDTFGSELYFSDHFRHPSDAKRISYVAGLVEAGWANRIVLGHDVFVKAHLHEFGGNGYDHLLRRVIPVLRGGAGFSDQLVHQLLVDNPRRLLACNPPGAPARKPAWKTAVRKRGSVTRA